MKISGTEFPSIGKIRVICHFYPAIDSQPAPSGSNMLHAAAVDM